MIRRGTAYATVGLTTAYHVYASDGAIPMSSGLWPATVKLDQVFPPSTERSGSISVRSTTSVEDPGPPAISLAAPSSGWDVQRESGPAPAGRAKARTAAAA